MRVRRRAAAFTPHGGQLTLAGLSFGRYFPGVEPPRLSEGEALAQLQPLNAEVGEALSYCSLAEMHLLKAAVRFSKDPSEENKAELVRLASEYEKRDHQAEAAVANWNTARQELGLKIVSNRAQVLSLTFPDFLDSQG
jgi:hypothetical protein